MRSVESKFATTAGIAWGVALTIGCAVSYFSMTAFAGSGSLPSRAGTPVLICTILSILTSASVARLRPRRSAGAVARASRIAAIAVSVPSVVIVALGLAFTDESSGVVLPALFLGAGAIGSWAAASALTVSASAPIRLRLPVASAISLLPLLLVWLRVVT
ncbi:hypothetical protein DEU32_103141 [Curtobacterium sp. AG1037]|nr:hypothetical protein DEU32_103141 [Curtobacterium sp. AG1037]